MIVPAGALVHALTLLLGALALHAQDGSMEGRAAPGAVLRLAGGAGVVRLTGQSARGAGAGVPPLAPNAVAAATGRLLRDAGVVTARESAGLVRYTVELRALGGAGSAPG